MTDNREPPEEQPIISSTAQPTAFDLWLNRGLHQLFDDVANEPVPDDLLKLINADKKK